MVCFGEVLEILTTNVTSRVKQDAEISTCSNLNETCCSKESDISACGHTDDVKTVPFTPDEKELGEARSQDLIGWSLRKRKNISPRNRYRDMRYWFSLSVTCLTNGSKKRPKIWLMHVIRIPFNQQIKNFESSLEQIKSSSGAQDVSKDLSKSIFFVGMGSNDYLNNCLMPNYDTKDHYNPQQFADLLVQQYSQQLTNLYNLGARKFVIGGIGLMGCIPSILAQSSNGVCSDEVNQLVQPFNLNTKTMVNNLITTKPGSVFTYIDIGNMFQDLISNAGSYGFSVLNEGCCRIGKNSGQITCLPFQTPCPDRSKYIFWDAFHPTEAVNVLFGHKAFNGSSNFAYPFSIQQLANF
ncbi:GDSL esterase/lipase At1g71691-like [Salvia hispanica]|uniref:GDSL esterase/lipase At1g71691-like n=1 Tax=Salvia hispanica TaxID=49212 RepID=UPI002009414E|nr:GDSL esterase/lipase At1g71691-like [Salvia hispanica]